MITGRVSFSALPAISTGSLQLPSGCIQVFNPADITPGTAAMRGSSSWKKALRRKASG